MMPAQRVLKPALTAVEKAAPKRTVCVTGGTGYVASAVIERLLAAGHTVHATCRDRSKASLIDPVNKMAEEWGASDRLKWYEADLLRDGSFDEAMEGCDACAHVAAVFKTKWKDPATELIDPAVKGTANVFDSVEKAGSVKTVVITSSVAAVCCSPHEHADGNAHRYNEEDWTSTTRATVTRQSYNHAKREQEKKAWELAEGKSFRLVSINPGLVMGPAPAERTDSASMDIVMQIAGGKLNPAPRLKFAFSDVRNVATAHCIALFDDKCRGRYLSCEPETTDVVEMGASLTAEFPKAKIPKGYLPLWAAYLVGPFVGFGWGLINDLWTDRFLLDTSKVERDMKWSSWAVHVGETVPDMVRHLTEKKAMPDYR
ncbi:unnamed protein product [Pedinophyceae sp. YPF-701]|nr:unnamed protein product [Pedinophyceae sp. YPF-701]